MQNTLVAAIDGLGIREVDGCGYKEITQGSPVIRKSCGDCIVEYFDIRIVIMVTQGYMCDKIA